MDTFHISLLNSNSFCADGSLVWPFKFLAGLCQTFKIYILSQLLYPNSCMPKIQQSRGEPPARPSYSSKEKVWEESRNTCSHGKFSQISYCITRYDNGVVLALVFSAFTQPSKTIGFMERVTLNLNASTWDYMRATAYLHCLCLKILYYCRFNGCGSIKLSITNSFKAFFVLSWGER